MLTMILDSRPSLDYRCTHHSNHYIQPPWHH
jgi:hypothetical protein